MRWSWPSSLRVRVPASRLRPVLSLSRARWTDLAPDGAPERGRIRDEPPIEPRERVQGREDRREFGRRDLVRSGLAHFDAIGGFGHVEQFAIADHVAGNERAAMLVDIVAVAREAGGTGSGRADVGQAHDSFLACWQARWRVGWITGAPSFRLPLV
jgi:hypothetical protein